MIPDKGVLVGLVSLELASDRGIPDVFLGIVPVPRNPYVLYASRCLDDGEVLLDDGCDWDTPAVLPGVLTAELER